MAVDDPSHDENGSSEDAAAEFGVQLVWPGSEKGGPLPPRSPAAPKVPAAPADEPELDDRASRGSASEDSTSPDIETGPEPAEPDWVRETVSPYEEPPPRSGGTASRAAAPPLVQHGRLFDPPVLSDQLPAVQAGLARFESLNASMSALASRVDALVAGTSDLRVTLADRLVDHADTIGRLVRSNATDIEERQRAVDRTLSDLRHSFTDSGEAARSIGSRIDELAADVAHLNRTVEATTDHQRELSGASDKLSRQVVEGLDAFGDRLLDRLDELDSALATEIGATRAEVGRIHSVLAETGTGGSSEALDARLAQLQADIAGLAGRIPDGDVIRDGVVEALLLDRDRVDERFDRLAADLAGVTNRVPDGDAIRDGVVAAISVDRDRVEERFDQLAAELARLRAAAAEPAMNKALRDEFAGLRSNLDELREQASGIGGLRSAIEEVHAEQADLARAAEGLLELREAIELVPDSEGDAEPLPGLVDADGTPIDLAAEFESLRERIAAQPAGPSQGDIRALRTALGELREDVLAWVENATGSADDGTEAALVALKGELSAIRKNTARVEAEVASMRADHAHDDHVLSEVAELRRMIEASGSNRGLTALKKELAAVKEAVEAPRPAASGAKAEGLPEDAADQLESVRAELVALRRRMNLKAKPTSAELDDAQLGQLAELVAQRLSALLELDIDSTH